MKFVFFCIAVVSSFAPLFVRCESTDCLVQTPLGSVQGKVEESRDGKEFCSFLGIPFAEKAKRFTEAKLKIKWAGIFNAAEIGPKCPQMSPLNFGIYDGEEDCLVLNVYSPIGDQCAGQQNGRDRASLPVFVHIHGGAYIFGYGGLLGPKLLMDECVVYVSINYRLGALGFLTTEDGLIPGNLGLKDQRLALQWIKKNIQSFGGNPELVTINGVSSGGACVNHLVASTSTKGLFQRAIAQSGSALNPWGMIQNPGRIARQLGQLLNCKSSSGSNKIISTAELKECLLLQKAEDIVGNQAKIEKIISFGPVVERPNAKNAFHIRNPYYSMKSGLVNKVPLIQGFCEDEGLFLDNRIIKKNQTVVDQLNKRWRKFAPYYLSYDEDHIPEYKKNEFSDKIRQFYFGKKNLSGETFQNWQSLLADRHYITGSFENVQLHAQYANVYPYVLSYAGSFSIAQFAGYTEPVTTHTDDLQYFYDLNIPLVPSLKSGSSDEKMSHQLIKAWLSFARTGKPTETWPKPNQWEPYSGSSGPWLRINSTLQEIPNYLAGRRKFWKDLGISKYDYPLP